MNAEERKAYQRAYHLANKEKINSRRRGKYSDYNKRYYEKHKKPLLKQKQTSYQDKKALYQALFRSTLEELLEADRKRHNWDTVPTFRVLELRMQARKECRSQVYGENPDA